MRGRTGRNALIGQFEAIFGWREPQVQVGKKGKGMAAGLQIYFLDFWLEKCVNHIESQFNLQPLSRAAFLSYYPRVR